MLKPVLTSLLFVIIFLSSGLSAGEKRDGWKREGWEIHKRVDDLTDELIVYQAWMTYSNYPNGRSLLKKGGLHRLIVRCDMETQDLAVWIFSLTTTGDLLRRSSEIKEEVTLEYRFNQESVLKEVWKKEAFFGPINSTALKSLNPKGFVHDLLRVMEGDKARFRFREEGQKTFHFDLLGGVSFVRDVLEKCHALPPSTRGEH